MKRTFTTILMTLGLLCGYSLWQQTGALTATLPPVAGVIYVVPGGTGDGSSWANGKDLAAALADAVSGDELWVKAGVYKPSIVGLADPRTATFRLKSGVALYGGFAGTETARSQRNLDPATNGAVLSGDFNGDDVATYNGFVHIDNNAENALHVVTAENTDSATRLDGFTIRGGNANINLDGLSTAGGGIYILGGSPVLTNLEIRENRAKRGSGVDIWLGSLTLTNVTLTLNQCYADGAGGGLSADSSDLTMTNVAIFSNEASRGGGAVIRNSRLTLTNAIVRGNFIPATGSNYGGGMEIINSDTTMTNVVFAVNYNGFYGLGPDEPNIGGGALSLFDGSATLTNVTFSGNTSPRGGAIRNASNLTLRNSIVWGNLATSEADEILEDAGSVTVSNSIVRGGYPGTNVLDVDPQFVQPAPYISSTPFQSHLADLRLQATSPAINAGDNSVTNPALPATDLDGNPRVAGGTVDLGAYERPPNTAPTISANTVTRTAGVAASGATIATVNDVEDAENRLSVTATPASGSGVTLSGISVYPSGNVTATIGASCTATNSTFTLRVTDSGNLSATATLTVTVNANQLPVLSYPANPGTIYGTGITVNPLTGPSDDLGITSVVVQSITPSNPGGITVNSSGVVTVANNVPAGNYTVTIRANAACGNKDAGFTLGIAKATPVITWNNPANITCNTPLGATQLNATANVPGSFVYTPPAGTILSLGSGQPLSVTFTPTNTANYNTASRSVTINVVDTTAPTLTLKSNLTFWPPDHMYRTVTMSQMVQSVSDGCSTTLGIGNVVIEKVTSDEPDDVAGDADGNTTNDIVIAADCKSVQLRAERDETKNGRVYVITLRVRDASNNTTRKDFKVSVPIGQNGTAVQGTTALTKTSSCP
jgi:predicted outer membrane repeat protein